MTEIIGNKLETNLNTGLLPFRSWQWLPFIFRLAPNFGT